MSRSALTELPDPAKALWGDGNARLMRIRELCSTYEAASCAHAAQVETAQAQRLLEAFGEDVQAGMDACGWTHSDLDRNPIRMKIVPIRPPGLALPPREIQISANFLAAVGREESTDSFVRTWVQELSHVRHPIPDDYWLELENYTGYEEGLAEGVARLLVIQDAGMHPRLRAYSHYAYAYRYLAEALHVDPTALFRELWKAPMGRVREWLPEAVDGILHQNGVSRPSSKKPQALRRAADELFFRGKSFLAVDETALRTAWQEALS